jgi:defect-in-organelle-trafficking protein DotC
MATPAYTLSDLQNLQPDSAYYQHQDSADTLSIRLKGVRQAAEELGVQSALADESTVINGVLEAHSYQLSQVFNFRLLMYKDSVLPPVIVSAENELRISESGDDIRVGGKSYHIIEQVRFVTAPPTWRDYLIMNYPYPDYPNPAMLPKNSKEREAWKEGLSAGWKEGVAQALSIYQVNLGRLNRDFNGMVLYRELLAQNMVSPFYVVKQDKGITGDASHITVDDQSWQISAKPQLQLHSQLWQPVLMSQPVVDGS